MRILPRRAFVFRKNSMLYCLYFRLRYELRQILKRHERMRVNAWTARRLPDIGLPRMPPEARAAFRAVLDYEKPPGNGSVRDILELAEARGFVAHPSDWVPFAYGDDQFPQRYEPWAAWLARKGFTPYWRGVRLTAKNWRRWNKTAREDAFRVLLRHDRPTAHALMTDLVPKEREAVRVGLVVEFDAGRSYSGHQAKDVALLRQFLRDPSEKVKGHVQYKLANLEGLESEEANAAMAAVHFKKSPDGSILCAPEVHKPPVTTYLAHTTFDVLSAALGMPPEDFARKIDLADIKDSLRILILLTANAACRAIVAKRLVDAGRTDFRRFFEAADPETRAKGLRLSFPSPYPSTTFDFLGPDVGTLGLADMREIDQHRKMGKSVTRELNEGQLPVNTRHDPMREMALLADKAAAQSLLDEALRLGMAPDNPRLTMLRFNLAL
jgi:hypothetical protein